VNWEEAIAELIELVKTSAPHLWFIARRQVYAQVLGSGFAVLASALTVLGCKITVTYAKKRDREEEESRRFYSGEWFVAVVGAIIVGVVAAFLGLTFLYDVIVRLYNPDYYAIKVLIDLVKQ
jgi:uncharacterized membrane protein YjjP (DUF1212 family)